MLVIKVKLREIKSKGIGVFADQKIIKGQSVWVYNPVIDIRINRKDIPEKMKNFFEIYAVDTGEEYVSLNIDNARFINHSDNPNIKSLGSCKDNIAIRDIQIGEEITINYTEIDINGVDFICVND